MSITKKYMINLGIIPAILLLIFACGVVWWAAILVALLANLSITIETESRYRRPW